MLLAQGVASGAQYHPSLSQNRMIHRLQLIQSQTLHRQSTAVPEVVVLDDLQIDVSELNEFEKKVMLVKAKRIAALTDEIKSMGDEIALMEQLIAGNFTLPPHAPLPVKVFDNATKSATILRVTSDDKSNALTRMIEEKLQRTVVLQLQVATNRKAPLTDETLAEAHASILKREVSVLTIIAR
jgi:hypothetical protein